MGDAAAVIWLSSPVYRSRRDKRLDSVNAVHHKPESMSRSRNRRKSVSAAPSAFDLARDELFQHISRCDVIGADPEHQAEWFSETMAYMADRWHELNPKQLVELRTIGERFAKPARTSSPAGPVAEVPVVEEGVDSESDEESLDPVSA
jgi:hypothetical protein